MASAVGRPKAGANRHPPNNADGCSLALPAVVTHPPDLAADGIQSALDTFPLLGSQGTAIVVMRSADPASHAVQFPLGAIRLMRIEAAVLLAAIDPILQELDALARAFGSAAPESVGIPVPGRGRRSRLGDGEPRGQQRCCNQCCPLHLSLHYWTGMTPTKQRARLAVPRTSVHRLAPNSTGRRAEETADEKGRTCPISSVGYRY